MATAGDADGAALAGAYGAGRIRGAVAYAPLDLKVWCGARSLMQASKPRRGTKSRSRLPGTLGAVGRTALADGAAAGSLKTGLQYRPGLFFIARAKGRLPSSAAILALSSSLSMVISPTLARLLQFERADVR